MKLLVTGANGFIGRAVSARAVTDGHDAVLAARRPLESPIAPTVVVGEIGPATDWRPALNGVEVAVHLAARAHVMHDRVKDRLAAFRAVNVEGTRVLAEQAATAGVRRLVFVSSIKVTGETSHGRPLNESDPTRPTDPYGISKLEAEHALWKVASATGIEVVVVRPVLVYGPGAGGNLQRLLHLVHLGVPLPLASVENRRSLVGVGNLSALLLAAATHPSVAGEVFLAADSPAISTATLVRLLAEGVGRPARLLSVPPALLFFGARMFRASAAANRLLGSLEVDAGKARRLLGWAPETSLENGLHAMGEAYRAALER